MAIRLNKAMRLLNIGKETAVEYLNSIPGLELPEDVKFSSRLTDSQFEALQERFPNDYDRKEEIVEKNITISLANLIFSKRKIIYRTLGKKYTLYYDGILPPNLNQFKFRNIRVEIILNPYNKTFSFANSSILNEIIELRKKEIAEQMEKERQRVRENRINITNEKDQANSKNEKSKNTILVPFRLSEIKIDGSKAFVDYNELTYFTYLTKKERKILKLLDKNTVIYTLLNFVTRFLKFTVNLSELFDQQQNTEIIDIPFSETNSSALLLQRNKLCVDNIEFFNGYYLIFILKNGKKDSSITPLRINDANSFSCLKFIHKYLQDRFPKNIEIVYDRNKVIKLSQAYTLGKYIMILNDNIEKYGEWWEEVQNDRKPSLPTCRKIPQQQIRRIISLKNCYLDYLSGIPNQRNIIKVYEVRQNQQEDVIIFSVELKNRQIAVIFENVSFVATATWVFIVDEENYKENINRIFDYFTNYEIHNKRQSLTKKANPPEKFKAVDYHKIMHDEPQGWMRRLNDILNREIPTNRIQFNQGLHISEESISRSSSPEEIKTKHIHNELMRRLYNYLSEQYGEENVGTENRIGTKKIDVVVKISNGFNIYEIKSDPEPRNCIREAMGQILDYAYFECEDTIHQMTIVGKTPETKEVNAYLTTFRNDKSLEIYYMSI